MNTYQASDRLEDQVLEAIVKVAGTSPVKLHEPTFDGNEWNYLKECLDSTYVSSVGKFVDKFESDLVDFTGAKYAVSVVNGTAALHIALKLSGVKSNDEVLVPALSFVATANAVAYCNAVPHFVDSEENTLGMDAEKLREYLKDTTEKKNGLCVNSSTKRVIRAMVPMHTFGHPANIEELLSVSREFNIVLVEDAAESIGSYYFGKHTGTFGLFGALSFNGNKTITTGGGGALLTNDKALASHAKHLTTTAKIPHKWEFSHDEVGYNYRMPNINAALGCAQLERLPNKLEAKRKLFDSYNEVFKNNKFFQMIKEPANCKSNYWLQTMKINNASILLRDKILDVTNNAGYMTRPTWVLLSELGQFNLSPKSDLTMSRKLFLSLINIPSSDNIKSLDLVP
jgi:aminotransferase in exopolysaccharide biosynthesis